MTNDTSRSQVTPPVRGSTGSPPIEGIEPAPTLNTAVPVPGVPMSEQPDSVVLASANQPDPQTSNGPGASGADATAENPAVERRTISSAMVDQAKQALADPRLRNRGLGEDQATGNQSSSSPDNNSEPGNHASSITDVGVMRSVPQTPPPDAE